MTDEELLEELADLLGDEEDEELLDEEEDLEDKWLLGGDDEDEEECIPCVICSKLIGDEVGYGDDWGEGPICDSCAGDDDEEEDDDQ